MRELPKTTPSGLIMGTTIVMSLYLLMGYLLRISSASGDVAKYFIKPAKTCEPQVSPGCNLPIISNTGFYDYYAIFWCLFFLFSILTTGMFRPVIDRPTFFTSALSAKHFKSLNISV